jgi:hypothetical protein
MNRIRLDDPGTDLWNVVIEEHNVKRVLNALECSGREIKKDRNMDGKTRLLLRMTRCLNDKNERG